LQQQQYARLTTDELVSAGKKVCEEAPAGAAEQDWQQADY